MSNNELVELLRILREHGVTKYVTPEVTLELGAATFAPTAGNAIPDPTLSDIERQLQDMAATRAIDSLPPQYRSLLRGS